MRFVWLLAADLLIFLANRVLAAARSGNGNAVVGGTVMAVTDGDTLQVRLASGPTRVRPDLMDVPETTQPWGKAAKAALERLVGAVLWNSRWWRRTGMSGWSPSCMPMAAVSTSSWRGRARPGWIANTGGTGGTVVGRIRRGASDGDCGRGGLDVSVGLAALEARSAGGREGLLW
jgi:hypothetical protein